MSSKIFNLCILIYIKEITTHVYKLQRRKAQTSLKHGALIPSLYIYIGDNYSKLSFREVNDWFNSHKFCLMVTAGEQSNKIYDHRTTIYLPQPYCTQKAQNLCNFGLSECNSVKGNFQYSIPILIHFYIFSAFKVYRIYPAIRRGFVPIE